MLFCSSVNWFSEIGKNVSDSCCSACFSHSSSRPVGECPRRSVQHEGLFHLCSVLWEWKRPVVGHQASRPLRAHVHRPQRPSVLLRLAPWRQVCKITSGQHIYHLERFQMGAGRRDQECGCVSVNEKGSHVILFMIWISVVTATKFKMKNITGQHFLSPLNNRQRLHDFAPILIMQMH